MGVSTGPLAGADAPAVHAFCAPALSVDQAPPDLLGWPASSVSALGRLAGRRPAVNAVIVLAWMGSVGGWASSGTG